MPPCEFLIPVKEYLCLKSLNCCVIVTGDSDWQELCALINPLAASPDYGVNLYCDCVAFVLTKVNV